MLVTTVKKQHWEDNVHKVCLAYNSSIHSLTGYTPFFPMFKRQVKLPVDLMYGTDEMVQVPVPTYMQELKEAIWEAYAQVQIRIQMAESNV